MPLDVIIRLHRRAAHASLDATGDRLLLSILAIIVAGALALWWRSLVYTEG